MKKLLLCLIIFASIFLIGCGGGGSEGNSSSWNGAHNADGFPDVTGDYSFNFSRGEYECSDGSSTEAPAAGINIRVTQTKNAIEIVNTQFALPAGAQLIDITNPSGTVSRDGNFTAYSTTLVRLADGNRYLYSYSFDGQFFPAGLSGEIDINASLINSSAYCRGRFSFDGEKL